MVQEGRAWIATALDARAKVAIGAIRRIRASGVTSYRGISRELNKLAIPTPSGWGKWRHLTVLRVEDRAEKWNLNSHPHLSRNARKNLERMLPALIDLKATGVTGYTAIAQALNERGVSAPSRKKGWTGVQVGYCLSKIAW